MWIVHTKSSDIGVTVLNESDDSSPRYHILHLNVPYGEMHDTAIDLAIWLNYSRIPSWAANLTRNPADPDYSLISNPNIYITAHYWDITNNTEYKTNESKELINDLLHNLKFANFIYERKRIPFNNKRKTT